MAVLLSEVERNFSMPENFGRETLAICFKFSEVLSTNYLCLQYLKKLGAGFKFAKVFFAKCNLACYLTKFSPAKILRYMVFVTKV